MHASWPLEILLALLWTLTASSCCLWIHVTVFVYCYSTASAPPPRYPQSITVHYQTVYVPAQSLWAVIWASSSLHSKRHRLSHFRKKVSAKNLTNLRIEYCLQVVFYRQCVCVVWELPNVIGAKCPHQGGRIYSLYSIKIIMSNGKTIIMIVYTCALVWPRLWGPKALIVWSVFIFQATPPTLCGHANVQNAK